MRAALVGLALTTAGCPDPETNPEPPALFASDWASRYQEVRNCRRSADHELRFIRILADDLARDPYLTRTDPFPNGAVILKAEHDDDACTDLVELTVMRREPGFDPQGGDWHWQSAAPDGTVLEDGKLSKCSSCHLACGVPPDGFDGTCAVP